MNCKIAAFDVDAVMLDLHAAYIKTAESLGFNLEILRNSRDTKNRFGVSSTENNQIFKALKWNEFPVTPWAYELLNLVKKKGFKPIFVSACSPKKKELRFLNLSSFFDVDKNDVHCVGRADKSITLSVFNASFFVDDSPDNVIQCQESVKNSFLLDLGFDDIDCSGVRNKLSIDRLLQHIDKNF